MSLNLNCIFYLHIQYYICVRLHCVVNSKQNTLVKVVIQTYNYLEEYIDGVRAKGRYAFTLEVYIVIKKRTDLSQN